MDFNKEELEEILCQPVEIDLVEQSRQRNIKITELKTVINNMYEQMSELRHENRTLKNNLNAYIAKRAAMLEKDTKN